MENNWFTLHSHTFLWVKGKDGLIYNTSNHSSYSFKIFGKVEKLCNDLLALENLYSVCISKEDLVDDDVKEWIRSIIGIHGGFLTHGIGAEKKPISLKPILKIQDGVDYYSWKHQLGAGGEIIQNLHQLTFYINCSEYGNDEYYQQTFFPLQKCESLDTKKILTFIRCCRNPYLRHINIVGNLFSFPEYHKLLEGLSKFSVSCTIYIIFQDFLQNLKQINLMQWPDYIQFNILLDSTAEQLIPLLNTQLQISTLFTSQSDYLSFYEKFGDERFYCNARVIPIYNGKNIDFFESNVFIDQEELDNIALSKREIFIHQTLNLHDFGKLTIMPDSKVYANVNDESLGTIDDSAYLLVYREFTERQSWLRIRNQHPCIDCVYQWLCPSPSNYEIVIGKPNLCKLFFNR